MRYIKKEKLDKIKLDKTNMYVAIDFDKTITATESEDSWDATGKMLGKEFEIKLSNLYKKYRPIELNYQITFEEKNKAMENWYQECMNLYYEYHLTKDKLEKSIEKSNLIFRSGAKEFLAHMNKYNIPVIILSAGIGNVIEIFLKENKCYYDNIFIISNFISFDKDGKMLEFTGELIHSLNKNMKNHIPDELQEKLNLKKNKVLIGDAIEDKKMVPEEQWDETILVGFLNENIKNNLEKYKNSFDITLTNNDASFENLENCLNLSNIF